ncbi:MAG: molybdenum cofactor biosynthesis protein MoaE [Gemmatimonadaceae bacterium]
MRGALTREPLDPQRILAEVADAACGALILFVGTVRDMNDGRAVTGMEYSAYEAMAEREMTLIAAETGERFGTAHVVIEHRLGALALGDASVAIAVAHPHRAEAYGASRYAIEQLKQRVPVWKREHYADGTREWVDPTRAHQEVLP